MPFTDGCGFNPYVPAGTQVGVVFHDKSLLQLVYDAIDQQVGNFLRVKNNYNTDFDPNISYGYRALLGNLKFESGQTVGSVFLQNERAWLDLARHMNLEDSWNEVLMAFGGMADQPLNMSAEVQLVYEPYVSQGRTLSHIHYKIVRCETASELLRDAKKPHKNMLTKEAQAAVAACASLLD